MCWMQNRNLKLTAKGRLWVRSTRVHHDTRTRRQPEAAGCLQEERCLQAAFSLLAGINCLILFPSVLGLHFHEVFRLIHSRVTGTHVKSVLVLVGSWFSNWWLLELRWCWPLRQERRHRGEHWAAPGLFLPNCMSLCKLGRSFTGLFTTDHLQLQFLSPQPQFCDSNNAHFTGALS